MSQSDIERAKAQAAEYERMKEQLRWRVKSEQLRAGHPTPIIQAEVKNEPAEAKAPPRKKPPRKLMLASQIINDKYPNGTQALSDKDLCAGVRDSLPKGKTISDTTILEAAGRKQRRK